MSTMLLKRSAAFLVLLLCAFLITCGGSNSILSVLTSTQQSEHYTYHYTPGDSVDPDRQEAFYNWDSAHLSLSLAQKIQYYKFTNITEKEQLTGNSGNAESNTGTLSLYTLWSWDNHETTHLLSDQHSIPCALINEGLAVSNQVDPFDNSFTPNWNGQPPHLWAQQYLEQGTLPKLTDILESGDFWKIDDVMSYAVAGSFIEYLSETYGVSQVLQLFTGATYNDSAATTEARFQQVFGISFAQAEQDWRTFLLQYTPSTQGR
jgi:hypothetical protein